MKIEGGNVFGPDGTFQVRDLFIEDGRYAAGCRDGQVVDASGLYVIPGLVDLHFHGCAGVDFSDGSLEALETICRYQAAHGITDICPATMSLTEEQLRQIFQCAASYQGKEGAVLRGIRMEGPFLGGEKKGVQNPEALCLPDTSMVVRLQKAAAGLLKILDIDPMLEGALDLIQNMRGSLRFSLAHTAADYVQAMAAFEAGASQVTHLYNAMQGMHHRAPGLVGAALDEGGCFVELICDGQHVHPAMIRNTFQMFGVDRIILISDSMRGTGMPGGMYDLGGQLAEVKQGKAVMAGSDILAGSVKNLMDCLRYAVKEAGVPLASALRAATVNPARSLGVQEEYGTIELGKTSHVVLLDPELELVDVWM